MVLGLEIDPLRSTENESLHSLKGVPRVSKFVKSRWGRAKIAGEESVKKPTST